MNFTQRYVPHICVFPARSLVGPPRTADKFPSYPHSSLSIRFCASPNFLYSLSWVAHTKEEGGRLPHKKQICPRSATKSGRHKIPTFCSASPGRRLPATVALRPACPRTAALRLALCPIFSRVSPFTFVLTCAHLPAFHSHFLTAHNTGTVFLNFFSLNHIFFCLFQHGTVSRAKSPVPDADGFKLCTSLVHCASHSTSSSTQIQER